MDLSLNIKSIPMSEIGIDYYQRPIYPSHVREILKQFDERLVELPRVCWRDNRWECWDGQHTIHALKAKGYDNVHCIVTEVVTLEEAANLFVTKNSVRYNKPLTSHEDLNGRRYAKDAIVLKIDRILAKNGFRFSKSAGPLTITSVRTPESIAKKYGIDILSTTLDVIASCYAEERVAMTSMFMKGLAYFIKRNGRMFSVNSLKKKLAQTNAVDIKKEAETSRMFKGVKAYENVFRGIYQNS